MVHCEGKRKRNKNKKKREKGLKKKIINLVGSTIWTIYVFTGSSVKGPIL